MSGLGDGEIAREARRILRLLDSPGAHLRPAESGVWRVVRRARIAPRDRVEVSAALVAAFAKRDWLARAGAHQTDVRPGEQPIYALSDAGRGWLRRMETPDDPFAAQHQLRRATTVRDARGIEQPVTLNDGESPLARLRQRRLIDRTQFEAGETLRRDFTLAGLSPRLGVDLAAPVLARSRGVALQSRINDTVLAAKQRFAAAMRAAGPGLSDLLFDVCCHLRGLEDARARQGLARPFRPRRARHRARPPGGSLRPAGARHREAAGMADGGGGDRHTRLRSACRASCSTPANHLGAVSNRVTLSNGGVLEISASKNGASITRPSLDWR